MTAQEAIDEIHSVAARRIEAYHTLDVLERELSDGGGLPPAFRGLRRSPAGARETRPPSRSLHWRFRLFVSHLDKLRQSVPFERVAEIDHYWDIEHTTSHSLLRDMGRTPPP